MIKTVDNRFLTDNQMFSVSDISKPIEISKVKQYEDIEFMENDEYKLIVCCNQFIFVEKANGKKVIANYPQIMDGVDYTEHRFKEVLSKYRLCIELAEDFGFEVN